MDVITDFHDPEKCHSLVCTYAQLGWAVADWGLHGRHPAVFWPKLTKPYFRVLVGGGGNHLHTAPGGRTPDLSPLQKQPPSVDIPACPLSGTLA